MKNLDIYTLVHSDNVWSSIHSVIIQNWNYLSNFFCVSKICASKNNLTVQTVVWHTQSKRDALNVVSTCFCQKNTPNWIHQHKSCTLKTMHAWLSRYNFDCCMLCTISQVNERERGNVSLSVLRLSPQTT